MELIYSFRKNVVLMALKTIIITLFLFLVYMFFSFSTQMTEQMTETKNIAANKQLFTIADTLIEPDEFYDFRQSLTSVETVQRFYDLLDSSDTLTYLSAFDQPLFLEDFHGGIEFNARYGTGGDLEIVESYVNPNNNKRMSDIKSFQVNQNFFEFYNLQLSQGEEIAWEQVAYESDTLPILLGADYEGIYEVGDVLKGVLYERDYNFKIVGFLKKNTAVFYKNDMNKYLDNHILVPYPSEIVELTAKNKDFLSIIYFAMINGDIVIDQKYDLDFLNKTLATIAKNSDFYEYTLLTFPTFALQYQRMYELIKSNQTLLRGIISCMFLAMLVIVLFLTYKIYERRKRRYYVSYCQGWSLKQMKRLIFQDLLIGNLFTVLIFCGLFLFSDIKNIKIFSPMLLVLSIFLLLDYHFMTVLLKKDIHANFKDFY